MKVSIFKISVVFIALLSVRCSDLLEKEPPNSLLPGEAIQNQDDLEQVLISAYDVLANTYNGDAQNLANLVGDNVARPVADARYESVWLRSSTIFNTFSNGIFLNWYIAVLRANTVIDNLDEISIPDLDRDRIEGEARFIRALCHFDLVRVYAQPYGYTSGNTHPGIAIRNSADAVESAVIERSSVGEVYNFILDDLAFAKENLPDQNSFFADRFAAIALEALVRFQMQEYQEAYNLANIVIETGTSSFASSYPVKYTYPEVSPEAIFYIFSADLGESIDSRNAGFRNNWNSQGNVPNLQVTEEFFDAVTLDGGPRAEQFEEVNQDGNVFWVTNTFNEANFNIPVLTYTQMLLIRAESAAELGTNLSTAIADINTIRERAYGGPVNNLIGSASAEQVLEAARTEFRFEFPFTGQRTHDLRRRGAQGENIVIRGAPWDCPGSLIQFPATEATELFPLNPRGGC